MATLRLKYENGHFTPLDAISGVEEGAEIEVQWEPPIDLEAMKIEALQTAGAWAAFDGIEDYMADVRQQWDDEWQQRLISL